MLITSIVFGAGLGFVTSLLFVFLVGVFVSSWLGATVFWIGEWFIKRMPFVKHLYSASKQISSAISPGKEWTFIPDFTYILCWGYSLRVLFHPQTRDCHFKNLHGFFLSICCLLHFMHNIYCLNFILHLHCRSK